MIGRLHESLDVVHIELPADGFGATKQLSVQRPTDTHRDRSRVACCAWQSQEQCHAFARFGDALRNHSRDPVAHVPDGGVVDRVFHQWAESYPPMELAG